MTISSKHWHFQPREFIGHMRMCGWLSDNLLSRLYPNANQTIRNKYRLALNQTMNKYSINMNTHRMIHFLGQGAHESSELSHMVEYGNKKESKELEINDWYNNPEETYFNMYNNNNGNIESLDGIKFRGRGMKQLTGRYNYGYYWAYRSWILSTSFSEPWWSPASISKAPIIDNPQRVGNEPFTTIDAGGWYWETTPIKGLAHGVGRPKSSVNSTIDAKTFSDELIRDVSKMINGGDNGLAERKIHTKRIYAILKDE
jgi:predicted chitinase